MSLGSFRKVTFPQPPRGQRTVDPRRGHRGPVTPPTRLACAGAAREQGGQPPQEDEVAGRDQEPADRGRARLGGHVTAGRFYVCLRVPGSGRHKVFAARGLASRPLTPSDYVRVTRVLAAAPLLPRRSGPTQRSASRVRRRRLQRTASKHAYAAHHVTHHERLLMLDAAKGYLRQRLAQGRRQEERRCAWKTRPLSPPSSGSP